MAEPERLRVDIELTDAAIAGWVTDAEGNRRRFEGWLALIALVGAHAPTVGTTTGIDS
jgi:hypothetical protein